MRILFVSTAFPNDLRKCVHGVFKRAETYIEAIKGIAQLSLLYYVSPEIDVSPSKVAAYQEEFTKHWGTDVKLFLCHRREFPKEAPRWLQYGAGVFDFFNQGAYRSTSGRSQVEAFDTALQSSPDLIIGHRLAAMCPLLLTNQKLQNILFDLDDIEHVSQIRAARQTSHLRYKTLLYLYVPALISGERRAIRLASETFVCSDSDRRYLSAKWHLPGISVVPNTFSVAQAQPLSSESTILFLGNFLYEPNVGAANFLIKEIWPRIRQTYPHARLIIAGDHPGNIGYLQNGNSGIELRGFVDDLDALYRGSRIVVVPILAGSGTRIKIIEAAAYGKPIIATSIGAEGLEMRDGRELLIRDTADAFADACVLLLKETALCEQLGRAARAVVVTSYDRGNVVRLIQSRMIDAMGKPAVASSPNP